MTTLLAQIARFFLPLPVPFAVGGPQQLMECAEARAGQNPRQARELRRAARAWLSVVR
jgi:hypothetical protein